MKNFIKILSFCMVLMLLTACGDKNSPDSSEAGEQAGDSAVWIRADEDAAHRARENQARQPSEGGIVSGLGAVQQKQQPKGRKVE